MDAAQVLFHREGFGKVGVDRLVAEVGMSKKTLYKEFGSKDNLLVEVVERCEEMAVKDFPDERDESTPRERLLGVFKAQQDYCETPGFSGCFFVNLATEFRDPTNPVVRRAGFHKAQLAHYVERQAELARLEDRDEIETLAQQIVVLHTGAADYALLYGRYPESTHAAVAALLTAHGLA